MSKCVATAHRERLIEARELMAEILAEASFHLQDFVAAGGTVSDEDRRRLDVLSYCMEVFEAMSELPD